MVYSELNILGNFFCKKPNNWYRIRLAKVWCGAWTSTIYSQRVHDKSDIMFVVTSMPEDVFGTFAQMSTRSFVARASNNALMSEKCLLALVNNYFLDTMFYDMAAMISLDLLNPLISNLVCSFIMAGMRIK
jgi:hypothetical protein